MNSSSHIPVPSRQFTPVKAIPSRHYTKIFPDESHVLTAAGQTYDTKTATFNPSHNKHRPTSGFLHGTKIQRAWEEKRSSSPIQSIICENREQLQEEPVEGTGSVSNSSKKTVTFCRKSSHRGPPARPASGKQQSRKGLILPKLVKANEGEDEMDGKMTYSPRNGYHVTDPQALAVIFSLEEALQLMKNGEQKAQREHGNAMKVAKERHQLEMSRERQRLHNQILTLSGIQHEVDSSESQSSHQRLTLLEQQLADKTAECCNLQAELYAKKVAAESAESLEKSKAVLLQAQVESLQGQLNTKEQELKDMHMETKQVSRYTSEKRRLQLAVQKERQQLMTDLASTQEQNASLQHCVARLDRELALLRQKNRQSVPPCSESTESLKQLVKHSQKEIERLQKSLSDEQQKYAALQDNLLRVSSKLEECQRTAVETSTELKKTDREGSVNCTLATERRELQTRNAMLTADLSTAQDIQCSLEKKIALLEDMLKNQKSTMSCMSDLETDLKDTHEALADRESQLSEMKEKCQALESSLEISFSTQNGKDQEIQLENEVYETKLELEGLTKTLLSEVSTSMDLKEELKCSQQECAALRDQLQLQRESAALSLNRIHQSSYRKQKKLVHQVKELRDKLREVHGSEKETKAECLRLEAQLTSKTTQLHKTKEANTLLNRQLNDKKASLVLTEQQMRDLSRRLEEEKAIQESIQTQLSHETQAHLECKTHLSEHKERLKEAEAEREELKHTLTETLVRVEQETQRNTSLQLLTSQAKQQLSAVQHTMRQREEEAQANLELLKKEHENEIFAVTSELQELRVSYHHLQEKNNMKIKNLERVGKSLQTECHGLQTRLQLVDKDIKEKTRKNRNLSVENTSLKSQLSDLQKNVLKLTAAQREYEDYAHKLEETTKSEIQQMFNEVGQHIQQQSESHDYLEQLRRENERMALQQKGRQTQELRQELAALHQQRKQEEVLLESLKFENQLMRVQLRGHARQTWQYGADARRDTAITSGLLTNGKYKLPPISQPSTPRRY